MFDMSGISRRALLITGGAVAVVTAGAGLTAWYPGTAGAIEPWRRAGQSFGDPRLDALAYAILAPNPHNRQPWQFTLHGRDSVDFTCDLGRRLPHTDPFDRQIVIGFGCMLELCRIAAAERGYRVDITPFPDGEPMQRLDRRRVASMVFHQDAAVRRDRLAGQMRARRSTKTVYSERPVAEVRLAGIVQAGIAGAGGTVATDQVARLCDLAWAAWMTEYETSRTRRESIDLMRIGNAEVAANPDGIEMGGLPMGLASMAGFITRAALDTPGSSAYEQGIAMFEPIIRSASGFIWLTGAASGRAAQLDVGRDWVRMNLMATALGIVVHPLSQALQEFPEMARSYRAVQEEIGVGAGNVVHMLGRIGYADTIDPTPRWPLESRLLT
jgi:hypothetical protein